MIIETKFEIDENVFLIHNNEIISLPVKEIEYENKQIIYKFLYSKGATNLDKDTYISRKEDNCFKTIKELAEYYERKLQK